MEKVPLVSPEGYGNRNKSLIACGVIVGLVALVGFRHPWEGLQYAQTVTGTVITTSTTGQTPVLQKPVYNSRQQMLLAAQNGGEDFKEALPKLEETPFKLIATIVAPVIATLGGLIYFFNKSNRPQLALAGGQHTSVDLSPLFLMMSDEPSEPSGTSGSSTSASSASAVAPKPSSAEVDFDDYNPSDLEIMYIDALWSYYAEGKEIMTDKQFNQLREELNWQGSGFPTLHRDEIQFVKAVLAFAKGAPTLNDEEYDKLKQRINSNGKSKQVTAFLVEVKGKQMLAPAEYAKLRREMKSAGVQSGGNVKELTLSDTPDTLRYEVQEVLYMYTALGLVPTAVCASAWGFLGFLVGGLKGIQTVSTVGFPLIGISSFLLTREMIRYLELTGPRIVKGVCPCCQTSLEASFFDVTPLQKVEKCPNCGTLVTLDAEKMLIKDAGGFTFIGADNDSRKTVDQYLSWASGVTSGILVGKNPISQLGGKKFEERPKPDSMGQLLQEEVKAGIFAWAVLLGYFLLGETFVSRARGKGIALHSGVINDFCKRFNIPNGLRQKYIQTAKRNGHELGFLVDGYGMIGDGLFGKQAMAWWKSMGW